MESIIQELQQMASSDCSVIKLLRKSKIVAVKLGSDNISRWIENELNGYSNMKKVPKYRKMLGAPNAWNPHRGWIPLIFDDPKIQDMICSVNIESSIGELQDLLKRSDNDLKIEFSSRQRKAVAQSTGHNTRYALSISRSSIANILESVKNKILDWSLNLEKTGIIGKELTFTDDEKKKAHSSSEYVNVKRIDELRNNQNKSYDLTKLVRMCEELNCNYQGSCYFSCAILLRAVIDHIPPIFNQKTFSGVINNYKGSKSFKKSMTNLQSSLRNISDAYLHEHIRDKEVLPNGKQIDFSNDLDVLLGEICRLLK